MASGVGNRLQRGSALVTGLVFLVAIIMLGLSASSSSIQQEMGVRNIRDQAVALEAADAALRAGETYLRSVSCQVSSAIVRAPGFCNLTNQNCIATDWGKNGILFGTLDGTAPLPNVYAQPRYIIEEFPGGASLSGSGFCSQSTRYYRITALGIGLSANTDHVVQSIYRY
jgi:type IV pilus assembly protein PilX